MRGPPLQAAIHTTAGSGVGMAQAHLSGLLARATSLLGSQVLRCSRPIRMRAITGSVACGGSAAKTLVLPENLRPISCLRPITKMTPQADANVRKQILVRCSIRLSLIGGLTFQMCTGSTAAATGNSVACCVPFDNRGSYE